MNIFRLYILGCGSATPTLAHYPSCQVLDIRGKLMMIDCGEGAQRQFRAMKLSFARLSNIFISHLHGDHCFGLPGLLSTMALTGNKRGITIYGPSGIKEFVDDFIKLFGQQISYNIITVELPHESGVLAYEDNSCIVETLKLNHRIPTIGYVFTEKNKKRHLRKDMLDFYNIPLSKYKEISDGKDFVSEDGVLIPNNLLSTKGTPPRKYAYISDTTYRPQLIPYLKGVSMVYHESTFLKKDEFRAYQTGHSTSESAAKIAKAIKASQLLLGHYSARYNDINLFEEEAKTIFPNTKAVKELDVFDII